LTSYGDMKLQDGSTVVIIGGGPAGSSCAIKLKKETMKLGKEIRVVLFEGKYFDTHYNQCLGILSPPILSLIERELEITFPREIIKQEISGYRVYSCGEEVLLFGDEILGPTYAVRRSNFDKYLLGCAGDQGVEIVKSRVTGVEFGKNPGRENVRIYSEGAYLRADMVVGAFGLDEAMLSVFEESTAGKHRYIRPARFLKTIITKFHPERRFIKKKLGSIIYAVLFPPSIPNIEFAAIAPKGDHVVVNIAGKRVTSEDMDALMDLPEVRRLLPDFNKEFLDYYSGKFPICPAKNPYGDRYILVGDATGWIRPFKGKGVNTAIFTGVKAAENISRHGISRKALENYASNCKELMDDYIYGLVVRYMTKLACRTSMFKALLLIAQIDPQMYEAFYNAASGQDSYKNIIRSTMSKRLTKRVSLEMIRHLSRLKIIRT
jgi:flavin-dependent dehydrogenase